MIPPSIPRSPASRIAARPSDPTPAVSRSSAPRSTAAHSRLPAPRPGLLPTLTRRAVLLGSVPLAAALAACSGETKDASTAGPSGSGTANADAILTGPSDSGGITAPGLNAANAYVQFPQGPGTATHTLTVLLDFRCPFCKVFSDTNGEQLRAAAEEGTTIVRIVPRPMLDRVLPGDYSLHTAGVYAAAFAQDPALAWQVESALFAHQPAEDAEAPAMEEILGWVETVGLDATAIERARGGAYDHWLTGTVEKACRTLDIGTPTLYLDGAEVADQDWSQPERLQKLLAA